MVRKKKNKKRLLVKEINNMAKKETSILEKLQKARDLIRKTKTKKAGNNEYSHYDYFTPEQVEKLVSDACEEVGVIILCNLKGDENGYYQTLDFVDIKYPEEKLSFELRTEKGAITATSAAQQMGGTDTYSERYIKMKVFQIKDNNLDLDSQDNRKGAKKEKVKVAKKDGKKVKTADDHDF